jgi:hypothetical protein
MKQDDHKNFEAAKDPDTSPSSVKTTPVLRFVTVVSILLAISVVYSYRFSFKHTKKQRFVFESWDALNVKLEEETQFDTVNSDQDVLVSFENPESEALPKHIPASLKFRSKSSVLPKLQEEVKHFKVQQEDRRRQRTESSDVNFSMDFLRQSLAAEASYKKKQPKRIKPIPNRTCLVHSMADISYNWSAEPTRIRSLPRPVRLLRIPKASSSSFSAFLRLQYGCITEAFPPGDCTEENSRACPSIEKCYAHFPPIAINHTDNKLIPMVTVFRDPVERYISAYHYEGHHSEGTFTIVDHIRQFPMWNNSMTNFMSSRRVGDWGYRFVIPRNLSLTPYEEKQKKLEDALALLKSERIVFVGLVEQWEDSLRLFCRMFACPCLLEALKGGRERHNRNSTQKTGYPYNNSRAMDWIRRAHDDDYVLYNVAQRRFCVDLFRYADVDKKFKESLSSQVLVFCHSLLERKAFAD